MHASDSRPARQPSRGVTAIYRRRRKVDGCELYVGFLDGELAAVEKVWPGQSEAAAVARIARVLWPNGTPVPEAPPKLRLVKPTSDADDDRARLRSVRALLTRAARAPLSSPHEPPAGA